MCNRKFISALVIVVSLVSIDASISSTKADVNVTQHHNHMTRDGLYIDPAFTYSAAAVLTRDTNFNGTISGNVYAQPLYIENGPGGQAMVIAVTESNNVYALNAASGKVIWQDHLGAPVPLADLPCGDIDPEGITGTPVVDLTNRTIFMDAMTTPDGGTTNRHLIYSVNVDTGATNSGWPVDVNTNAIYKGTNFNSGTQQQRPALAFLNGYVYVGYGGLRATARPITAGWWACRKTIPRTSMPGPRAISAARFGAPAASPAMTAFIPTSLPAIPLARPTGPAAKPSFVFNPARFSAASPMIIGCPQTGWLSTALIRTLVVPGR